MKGLRVVYLLALDQLEQQIRELRTEVAALRLRIEAMENTDKNTGKQSRGENTRQGPEITELQSRIEKIENAGLESRVENIENTLGYD